MFDKHLPNLTNYAVACYNDSGRCWPFFKKNLSQKNFLKPLSPSSPFPLSFHRATVSFPWTTVSFPWSASPFPWSATSFPWSAMPFPWTTAPFPWSATSFLCVIIIYSNSFKAVPSALKGPQAPSPGQRPGYIQPHTIPRPERAKALQDNAFSLSDR